MRRANKDAISGATAATFPQQQQEDRDSLDTRVSTLKNSTNSPGIIDSNCVSCVCVQLSSKQDVCVSNRATGTVEKLGKHGGKSSRERQGKG